MNVFELAISVKPEDIDLLGHVNNVVYVRWIQDVAVAHWYKLSTEEDRKGLVWVVTRHEIDYKASARIGDPIVARTWVGPATRFRFERHTEIVRTTDRVVLVRARTEWCPIDMATGRPVTISPALRAACSVSA